MEWIFSVKLICFLRVSLMFMPERMASNFLASRAGMMLSKSFSTHSHLAPIFWQMALPRSISNPTSWPSGSFDSNGA